MKKFTKIKFKILLIKIELQEIGNFMGPDSGHKHIPGTENRLKTLVQNPDLKKKRSRRHAGVAESLRSGV